MSRELALRGASVEPLPGETIEQHHDRLDTALMALFRDTRRSEAFEALYEHSRERVTNWLRWIVHEQQTRLDPVELLQDTFVNVYRYSAGFRSDHPASFRSWVRTIAANVVRRARAARPLRWARACQELGPELVDGSSGPHLRVVDGEETADLRRAWTIFLQHYSAAFAALSPRDRRALELVEVEGASYAEAGRRLGVGPSNMKMIMLRARRRLQARMQAALAPPSASLDSVHRERRRTA